MAEQYYYEMFDDIRVGMSVFRIRCTAPGYCVGGSDVDNLYYRTEPSRSWEKKRKRVTRLQEHRNTENLNCKMGPRTGGTQAHTKGRRDMQGLSQDPIEISNQVRSTRTADTAVVATKTKSTRGHNANCAVE